MTSTGTVGSSAHESRTFDCPWCGAISPVPADHLGEHFACPECRQQTKLTEKNTSTLKVTDAPPDAPHLTGDRTFDCPWCGAISAVPSSHLGERFQCPECKRDTKLTPTNTRRAPLTAAPPDAPPPEPTGAPKGLLVVAGLIVVGVGAWLLTQGGGESKETEGTDATVAITPVTQTPTPPAASSSKKGLEAPPVSAPTPTPVPATPTALPPEPAPTNPAPAPAEPPAPVDEKALADRELSEASRAVATEAEASLALDREIAALIAADPEIFAAATRSRALEEALKSVPAPAAGADAIRAYDAGVAKALAKSPAGVEAAEVLRGRMAAESHGRGVAGLAWQDVDFHGDAFLRAAAVQREAWAAVLARLPQDRVQARADAARRASEANARLQRAQARRDALGK